MKESEKFISFWNETDGITLLCENDKDFFERLILGWNKVVFDFERPDFYLEFENLILLTEHFSFDSSKRVRKGGSSLKIEESKKSQEYQRYVKDEHEKGKMDVEYKATYKTDISFEDYESNLVDSFKDHLQWEEYKKHFIKDVNSIKPLEFALCIENTSILPDSVHKGLEMISILPINSMKFLKELETHQEVKHIFLLHRGNMGKKHIFYFRNISENITKLMSGKIIDNSYEFINWNPHLIGFSSIIPKE